MSGWVGEGGRERGSEGASERANSCMFHNKKFTCIQELVQLSPDASDTQVQQLQHRLQEKENMLQVGKL